jgi:hypothetical protein
LQSSELPRKRGRIYRRSSTSIGFSFLRIQDGKIQGVPKVAAAHPLQGISHNFATRMEARVFFLTAKSAAEGCT